MASVANCKRLPEAKLRWFMVVLGGKNGRITVYGYGFTDSGAVMPDLPSANAESGLESSTFLVNDGFPFVNRSGIWTFW